MDVQNLAQLHRLQAERLGARPALRYKRDGLYRDYSWEQYRADALALAAALVDAGVEFGERVGILAENSRLWLTADQAVLTAGAITVSPHAPLTARQVGYQFADADVVWCFVSNALQLDKVLSMWPSLPALRGVVVFDDHAARGGVLPWGAFLQRGRRRLSALSQELADREARLGRDDLATVMYTSGTTGDPKGVMLTHGNLLSNGQSCVELQPYVGDGVILGWLPLTHIYARLVDHYISLLTGVTLALAESPETLIENLAEIQPTNMAAVPRFYEKVLTYVASNDPVETGRRLRYIFGPRIDWISSGGAALPVGIARPYLDAGLHLMQGYGLTETSPVIAFNTKAHNKLGTVGRPIPGVEVRIADDGEILTRGPHVMKGYWKNPTATAEVLREGWFHTGDLGTLDADSFLSITGRKKELLVLSNGKKVAPSNLEGLLVGDPCIDQAIVCGEGRNFLTALIVPNWDNLCRILRLAPGESPETLIENPAVWVELTRRVDEALAELSRIEQIRKIIILPRAFSVEAEEMTVSLKLRREVILGRYAERIEALYQGEE
jgi:long-chain acyl-CoA synthetase